MVGYSIIILAAWLFSIGFAFWITAPNTEVEDPRDAEALRKATESSFFLRG